MTDQPRPAMTMREIREALGHNVNPQQAAEQLDALRRQMIATAIDQFTPEQHAEWDAADKEMARRIHAARPGVPLHQAFATLQVLRTMQRMEAAVVSAPVQPTTHADEWLAAAAECNKAGGAYAERGADSAAGAAFALMETFLRKAGEAEYVATPCDFVACEPGGEPCSTHERLMAHAEGDHELCAPDCGEPWMRRVAGEEQPATETPAAPVQHAPGKAIRCPDCRAKGYTVCQDTAVVARQDGATT